MLQAGFIVLCNSDPCAVSRRGAFWPSWRCRGQGRVRRIPAAVDPPGCQWTVCTCPWGSVWGVGASLAQGAPTLWASAAAFDITWWALVPPLERQRALVPWGAAQHCQPGCSSVPANASDLAIKENQQINNLQVLGQGQVLQSSDEPVSWWALSLLQVVVRVRFPDRHVLQGCFHPTETGKTKQSHNGSVAKWSCSEEAAEGSYTVGPWMD